MAEAIWYYAKHDQQKGPVTPAQLKGLAVSGELLPTDLIWKEGMGDWSPASDVKGLFPHGAATQSAAAPAATVTPKESSPEPPPVQPSSATPTPVTTVSPIAPAPSSSPATEITSPAPGSRWTSAPTPPAAPFAPPTAPPSAPVAEPVPVAPAPTIIAPRRTPRPETSPASMLGKQLLGVGLVLVLCLRGCDSLGDRYAARLNAMAEVGPIRFDEAWEAKKQAFETRRAGVKEEGLKREAELEKLQLELDQMNATMSAEREQLVRTTWRELKNSAQNASADQAIWNFWRQVLFVPATLLFVVGLFWYGGSSDGPERWLCWSMLAIIGYSLFVGGVAWR